MTPEDKNHEDKIAAGIERVATVLAVIAGILFTRTITAHCAPLISDGDEIASVGTEVRR